MLGEEVRRLASRDTIESVVADLAAAAAGLPADTSVGLWGRLTGAEPDETDDPRGGLLDSRLGRPLHDILWRRALLGATIVHAAVGATQLDDRIGLLDQDEPEYPVVDNTADDESTPPSPAEVEHELSPDPEQ